MCFSPDSVLENFDYRRISELRKEHADYIAEKRTEAAEAVALLQEHVRRKVEAERLANGSSTFSIFSNARKLTCLLARSLAGLVIEEAIYGVLEAVGDKTEAEEDQRWLDVTGLPLPLLSASSTLADLSPPLPSVALQALVTSSQLIIPVGRSKVNLLGFFDCAYGEKKRLRVRYSFKGRRHEVELGDLEAVAAPLRSHVVE